LVQFENRSDRRGAVHGPCPPFPSSTIVSSNICLCEPTGYSPRHFSTSAPSQSCNAPVSLCRNVRPRSGIRSFHAMSPVYIALSASPAHLCLVLASLHRGCPTSSHISSLGMLLLSYITPRNAFSLSVSHSFAAFRRHLYNLSSLRL